MKKFARLFSALVFCVVLFSGTAQAQLATGTVDFDVDTLRDQTQVTITLSDNSTLVLLRDYVVDDGPGKYTWIGFVQDDVNGRAFITVNAPNAVGTIQTSTKLYELAITEAGTDPVQEIDPLTLPPEAEPLLPPIFSDGFEGEDSELLVASSMAECDDTPANIDVMVLYSDDAARASKDIGAEIRNAISMTNDSFKLSKISPEEPDGIELKINLVHMRMVEVDENSGVGIERQLDDLSDTHDGYLDAVHVLRDQFKADLTFLILESTYHLELKKAVGGIAYMSDQKYLAFGIVRRDSIVGHTFTHELGHLFGADHDMYAVINVQKGLINITKSNYGYSYLVSPLPWRTVMSYEDECQAAGFVYCPRPGFFSSPDYLHAGVPRGVEGTDNRKQLIEGAGVRACYRARPKISVQKLNKVDGQPTLGGLVESSGSSVSPAISCGATCAGGAAAGSTVILTAKDKGGWKFVRWSEGGACAGSTAPKCSFTVTGDLLARPEFTEETKFVDWTSIDINSRIVSGTLGSTAVTFSWTADGSVGATWFNEDLSWFFGAAFTPKVDWTDGLEFRGNKLPEPTPTYTITFAEPVTDPFLHIASLASTLTFIESTPSLVSGDVRLSVVESQVIGTDFNEQIPNDANGTVKFTGTFSSLTFTAQYSGPGPIDGITLQVGTP